MASSATTEVVSITSPRRRSAKRQKATAKRVIDTAKSYREWLEAAMLLDRLEERHEWRDEPESAYYNFKVVLNRTKKLRALREGGDPAALAFYLRACMLRNDSGIGNDRLYTESYVGTKYAIHEYMQEVEHCLRYLCDLDEDNTKGLKSSFPMEKRLSFFLEARHAYGRTALLLSGGATLGLYHVGVIKALAEADLLPRVVSGSSVGSLIAAIVCTQTEKELRAQLRAFHDDGDPASRFPLLAPFEDNTSMKTKFIRLVRLGYLQDITALQRALRRRIGDVTFQEAFDRTGRALNITVSSELHHVEVPLTLNYLTAPHVLVWSAACASCSLPGLYAPAEILAKDGKGKIVPFSISEQRWVDGSVQMDLPKARLSELFNVNYFIVSQTNPHIIPFIHPPRVGEQPSTTRKVFKRLFKLVQSEVVHRCNQLLELEIMPGIATFIKNVLSQQYEGDVTITPPVAPRDYKRIITNPGEDDLRRCALRGERQTWPRLSLIQVQTHVEKTLEQCVRKLRAKGGKKGAFMPVPLSKMGGREGVVHAAPSLPFSSSVSGAVERSAGGKVCPRDSPNTEVGMDGKKRSGSVPENMHSVIKPSLANGGAVKNSSGRSSAFAALHHHSFGGGRGEGEREFDGEKGRRRLKNESSPPRWGGSSPSTSPSATPLGVGNRKNAVLSHHPHSNSFGLMPRVLSWLSTRGSNEHLDEIHEDVPLTAEVLNQQGAFDGWSERRRSLDDAGVLYSPSLTRREDGRGEEGKFEARRGESAVGLDVHEVEEPSTGELKGTSVLGSVELLNDEVDEFE
eukprot:CAMPEP_0113870406 /NCGR_PEP_ID=MMETSP0780_2-20120614/2066_1 /TAXON_ID=652834 /ORGANISM="Palpitomonas bilix" /LENGTH=796 /DNA_ID=CAMNT_0000855675 /DNA_START=236 /DNA_END=2626 /DNA_ORIENTATION=+ /assembly_acc=CAM_ASM_000599